MKSDSIAESIPQQSLGADNKPLESVDVSISSDFFKKNFSKLVEDPTVDINKSTEVPKLEDSGAQIAPTLVAMSPMKSVLSGVNKKAQLGKYGNSATTTNQNSFEARKRETEVAFSVMKSKLLNMGIPLKDSYPENITEEIPSIHSQEIVKKLKTDHSFIDDAIHMESISKPPLAQSKVGFSFEAKQSINRKQQFQQEEYINEDGVADSIAVNVDDKDALLGRNVHNNSLLTDDSGDCNHVFDFDSSDEFSIINQSAEHDISQIKPTSALEESVPSQSENDIKLKLEMCKATMQ